MMRDEYQAELQRLLDYRKCLDLLAKDATELNDIHEARKCIETAVRLGNTILLFQASLNPDRDVTTLPPVTPSTPTPPKDMSS